AVADCENFVLRFAHHAAKLVDLIADAQRLRANQETNPTLRKIARQFCNHRNRGVQLVADAEYYFIIGIILRAKASVVLVGLAVQSINRFEDADGRREIGGKRSGITATKKAQRRDNRDQ